MAIYKGREVQILGRADGVDVSPTYRVLDPYGQEEHVQLNQMQVTAEEKKQLDIENGAFASDVQVIKDKDLQDLRDGQDKEKIEARQAKEDKNTVSVAVASKEVPASSVKNK